MSGSGFGIGFSLMNAYGFTDFRIEEVPEANAAAAAAAAPAPAPTPAPAAAAFDLAYGLGLAQKIGYGKPGDGLRTVADPLIPQPLATELREIVRTTRTPAEVALLVQARVYAHFNKQEESKRCAEQVFSLASRAGQFEAFARRHIKIVPKQEEIRGNKPYPITIFNFTGLEMEVSSYDETRPNERGWDERHHGTRIKFPATGYSCDYTHDSEFVAFLNPETSRSLKYQGKPVIDILCLDEGQPNIYHAYHYMAASVSGKLTLYPEMPHPDASFDIPVETDQKAIMSSKIVGLDPSLAADIVNKFQVYEHRSFQVLRFDLTATQARITQLKSQRDGLAKVVQMLTRLFPLATAEYIMCSETTDLLLYRPNGDPHPAVLERSAPPTQVGKATVHPFMETRRNTSLSRWRFYLPPAFNSPAEESEYRLANPARWQAHCNANFSYFFCVKHIQESTPFEDFCENAVAFTGNQAVVASTAELMRRFRDTDAKVAAAAQSDQKSGVARGYEFELQRVTDESRRIQILTQLAQGHIRPMSHEQTFMRDEPVFLFERPDHPTIVRFTEKANSKVEISSNYNVGIQGYQLSTEVPAARNARNMPVAFQVGDHFRMERAYRATLHPYGRGGCSLPFLETEAKVRHDGKRMWAANRKTPGERLALFATVMAAAPWCPKELVTDMVDYAIEDVVADRTFA